MTRKTPPQKPRAAPSSLWFLMAVALVESGLALYQWRELLKVRSGGVATCALNETVNCATVWNSAFASSLHAFLGMPVAALGLVWGLTALGLMVWLFQRPDAGPLVLAVRLLAISGVLACFVFALDSLQSRAVCLTCLSTYGLSAVFGLGAFRLLPGAFSLSPDAVRSALRPLLAVVTPAFLLMLYPGLKTPSATVTALPPSPSAQVPVVPAGAPGPMSEEEGRVRDFFNQLSEGERQAVADSLEMYKASAFVDVTGFPVRARHGSMMAPTRMVEFTDMLCGHCAALSATVKELKRALPEGLLSIEARHYPLDSECNPSVLRTDGSGTRCLAAKAQICLEQAPDFWALREKLFESQASLTKDKVLELASSGSLSKDALVRCIESPSTASKLSEDIAYASRFGIQGTPLVILNGKKGTPVGAFLYAMAMSRSNVDSPVFQALPSARPPMAGEDHTGHAH